MKIIVSSTNNQEDKKSFVTQHQIISENTFQETYSETASSYRKYCE